MMDATTLISIRVLETINAELRERIMARDPRTPEHGRFWRMATTSVSVALLIVTLRILSA